MPTSVDVTAVCRVVVATLLVVSVAGKLADRGYDARELLAGAWPKTRGVSTWIVAAILVLELSSALMLFVSMTAGAGAALAAAIGLGGAFMILVARQRGYEGSCGCFGALDRSQAGPIQVTRVASLFVLGMSILVLANIVQNGRINVPEMITGVGLGIIWLIVFGAAEAIARVGATTNRLKGRQLSGGQGGGSRA